jgi:hypothetical protein
MMRENLRRGAVAAVACLLGSAAVVWGGETDRGGYDLALSTQTPGAATGLRFHILYKHPDDPEAKPPPVTGAVFELPPGLQIDDEALPQCTASDEDLRAQGRDACPAESQVGTGRLTAMTGFPGVDPVETDVVAFNGDGEVIEVVFIEGTNTVVGMDRLTIEDGKLVAHPPSTPGGPPDGRTAVREIRLDFPVRTGAGGKPYATAPADCPTGRWTSLAHYEFADGGKTTVTSESACTRAPAALRVSVSPREARVGERTVFRVRVRSAEPSCIARARVRIAGRRLRTGARGRTHVATTFRRPGRRPVVATKAGCRTGRTAVQVR